MSTTLTGAEHRVLRRTSWRLGLQIAGLVLLVLAAMSVTILVVVNRTQHAAGIARIESAASSIDDVHDAPTGMWVAVLEHGQVTTSADLPTGLPDLAAMGKVAATGDTVRTTVSTSVGEVTVVTGPNRERVVQAALDPSAGHEEFERLVSALLVAGGLAVVLAGLGGAWLARRAVQPTVAALSLQRRFVADASHELRTPLTLLSTRAQLLDRHMTADWGTAPPDRVQHDVDGLLADAAALTGVLDDMLLAADARSVDAVPVDVAEVADDVVGAARASAEDAGIALTRSGEPRAVALASQAAVRRAVTALVDNAIGHARSTVEVAVAEGSDHVTVSVVDDGPGLSSDEAQLFRRFASNRPEPDGDGERRHYGLGLALVAEVAAQHGGTVRASSRDDGVTGAVISLELPAARHPIGR